MTGDMADHVCYPWSVQAELHPVPITGASGSSFRCIRVV